ncbi:hypothetical protein SAMN02746065_107162 [Desulfocicer vacuolatum DSM 3385]|uniref:Uncharacterized protein n=1 Tax=Desulfocicer vacuolatum DSM 3385 TaxID=1121400 RepID=A0A1W2B9U0_9BACT|nr:hypothetical protein [Desulfocicer vacuolatum]SMC69540.1 hypothetical protein SAMN02746065_107162 [Desulfocicer vacuolatum DSM 3385]
MKPEITSGRILIQAWGVLLSMILANFFSKKCSLVEISHYLTLINILIYLATAVYGLISFVLASNNKLPGICAAIPIIAIVIMISMASMEIIWFLKDHNEKLIKWWDIIQEMLNAMFAVYIMTTMYIINNFEQLNEKFTISQIKRLHRKSEKE